MSIDDKDTNLDPKTLLGRLDVLEHRLQKQAIQVEQYDQWLRRLYLCVGMNYPGDEPQAETAVRERREMARGLAERY